MESQRDDSLGCDADEGARFCTVSLELNCRIGMIEILHRRGGLQTIRRLQPWRTTRVSRSRKRVRRKNHVHHQRLKVVPRTERVKIPLRPQFRVILESQFDGAQSSGNTVPNSEKLSMVSLRQVRD